MSHSPRPLDAPLFVPVFVPVLPSVSLVTGAFLRLEDALQPFGPDGRQLVVHIEAKLRVLLWQTEEQQVGFQHLGGDRRG